MVWSTWKAVGFFQRGFEVLYTYRGNMFGAYLESIFSCDLKGLLKRELFNYGSEFPLSSSS